jgi:HD superfamily phosphohydrolase
MNGRDRVIRDEIHRDILVPSAHATIIDTPEFQRLRAIQQLSTCEYVFPAATHNRFAHSLGAYHLAGMLSDHVNEVHPGLLSDEDHELVQLAALLHESKETALGRAVLEVLGAKRLGRLFALMDGADEHEGIAIPRFMKEIVSSQLDVDRMDYMIRDQANTGAQIGGFDSARVIRALRVGEDGRFVVKRWGLPAIEAYLVTRYHMYQQVYFHKVNMLTQAYLVNMLERARTLASSGSLKLSDELSHMLLNEDLQPEHYVLLNDAHVKVAMPHWANDDDEELSFYATRLLSRKDFHKSLRIANLTVEMADVVVPRVNEVLVANGYTPRLHLIQARISKRGYLPYDGGIVVEDGRDVAEHSALIRSLVQPHEQCLIFVPEAVRDELEQSVREWIKPAQSSLSQFD